MWMQACLSEIYFNITVMEFALLWALTAVLAKALPWHSIHCLALLNCHRLPWGRLLQHETARLKKEYGKRHRYWPLCLTFTGRLIIHYSWVSVCWSQASYCCLNQISISTIHELRFWTTPKLWPLSLPALRTSPCVFSDYARYLFSQMRPADQMARWIIMSFIFKSTALNSQWPNHFKYFLKLQQTHTPTTRRFSHSAHLFF